MYRAMFKDQAVDLLSNRNNFDLESLTMDYRRNRSDFRCAFCGEAIVLRNGDTREAHFAHKERQAKNCPYLSFPAGFHKRAEFLTRSLIKFYDQHYPDAKVDTEIYHHDFEIFFHLQVRFSDSRLLAFRFRRKNFQEKEWSELPTSKVIPGARSFYIVIGSPNKFELTLEFFKEHTDPEAGEIQPLVYYSNERIHILEWESNKLQEVSPDRIGIDPDGKIVVEPEPLTNIIPGNFQNPVTSQSIISTYVNLRQQLDLFENQTEPAWGNLEGIITTASSTLQVYAPKTAESPLKQYFNINGYYQCGHPGLVTVFCCEADVPSESKTKFAVYCPDCSSNKNLEKDILTLNKLNQGFADLKGSEKQIRWASSIRNNLLNEIRRDLGVTDIHFIIELIEDMLKDRGQKERLRWYLAFAHIMTDKIDAQWWITHKDGPINAYLRETEQPPARII